MGAHPFEIDKQTAENGIITNPQLTFKHKTKGPPILMVLDLSSLPYLNPNDSHSFLNSSILLYCFIKE